MTPIDLAHSTLYIRDRGSNYIAVRIGEGNLSYTEKRNVIFAKNRGELSGDRVREGDEEPIDLNFQFVWDSITTHTALGSPITVEDAIKKLNGASGWVSTNTDPDAPFCVDLQLDFSPACPNMQETLYFFQFNWTSLAHSLKDATIDCTGSCNFPTAIAAAS